MMDEQEKEIPFYSEDDLPPFDPDDEIPFDADDEIPFDPDPGEKVEIRDRRMKNWFWLENDLFKDERLRGQHILVYTVLCYHADSKTKTYECFPSLGLITRESRCSRPTVVQVIKDLVLWGYISKETHRRPGTKSYLRNTYTVHGPQHKELVKEKTTSQEGGGKGENLHGKGENHQVVKESNGNDTNSFNETYLTNVGALFDFFNISLEDREKHLKRGEAYVLEKLQLLYHTNKRKPVENPGGFLNDAIRNDWKEYKSQEEEMRESQRRAEQENREARGAKSKYPDDPEAQKFFALGRKTGTGEELKNKKIGDIKKELKQKELVTAGKQG